MNHELSDNPEETPQDGETGFGGENLASNMSDGEFVGFAEKKKTVGKGTIFMVGLVLAAGAGTWLMTRQGPRTATAAPEVVRADQTIQSFLSNGSENIRAMEEMLQNTQKVVEQFQHYPSVQQVPLSDLKTNPFKMLAAPAAETPAEDAEALLRQQREQERQTVLTAVQKLRLQSILHSDTQRACMINNALYQEGQQVDGFTIERISADAVIVRQAAYRFELKMQR